MIYSQKVGDLQSVMLAKRAHPKCAGINHKFVALQVHQGQQRLLLRALTPIARRQTVVHVGGVALPAARAARVFVRRQQQAGARGCLAE
jgi:hypothetical protein